VLDALSDKARSSYDIVKSYWATRITSLKAPAAVPAAATAGAPAPVGAQSNTNPANAAAAGAGGTQSRTASATQAAPPATKPVVTTKPSTSSQPANMATPNSSGSQPTKPATQQGAAATPTGASAASADAAWRKALNDGFIAGTVGTATPKTVAVKSGWANQPAASAESGKVEIVFRYDPSIYDGRFANNGWLQELPKPLSKLTWDNAAHVSPAFAKRENLRNGDKIKLSLDGYQVDFPVWVMPGQADKSIVVHLGYGRERGGRVAIGTGFNAYKIRTTTAQWFSPNGTFVKTGDSYHLVNTQDHWSMEGRQIVRDTTLEEYLKEPTYAKERVENPAKDKNLTLYPEYSYTGYKWGMSIDLNSCVGCNACVVACQSENNVPVVGKSQVDRGREMHWLRLDRYYKTTQGVHEDEHELAQEPELFFQPVPCMQCENAPCEVVCPVAATAHSAEGLNDMVYNRCVGTRYCSNNCPYKVRRFNFLLYQDFYTETFKFQRNPNVSVRSRGVMEKCTYCIQRIQEAKIEYEKMDKPVPDGAIVTACQQTCPANAIVFGNLNDPNSRVAKLKQEPRDFGLLEELNTRPRTTYLAEVRNPHQELKKEGAAEEHHG
jgi:molybdopterin-containing oxidoreductase family iron-sulfur binding subunit